LENFCQTELGTVRHLTFIFYSYWTENCS